MYLRCKTENSAQRQQQFELALLRLLETEAYEQVTVGKLTAQVGVSRNAFYRYFDSKDDVLYALIDHTLEGFPVDEAVRLSEGIAYREKLEAFLQYWKQCKPLLDALEKNALKGMLFDRYMKCSMGQESEISPYLVKDVGKRRYQVTLFAISGLFSLIIDWHHSGYTQTIPELIEVIERVLLHPIVSTDSKA